MNKGFNGCVCFWCGNAGNGNEMARAGVGNMMVWMCAGCVADVQENGPVFVHGKAVVAAFTAKWAA